MHRDFNPNFEVPAADPRPQRCRVATAGWAAAQQAKFGIWTELNDRIPMNIGAFPSNGQRQSVASPLSFCDAAILRGKGVAALLAFILSNVNYSSAQTGDPYEGSLNRSASRGVEIVKFAVPGGHPEEICVIPQHLPFAKYRADDAAAEKELARYDFYKPGNTPDNGAVAVCPKAKSTSAAVELFEIPSGSAKPTQETAGYCTQMEKTGKDLAKFKQTDNHYTTTLSGSILAYYHVSRVLGDICDIKPAVLRTMDIDQHKQVVKLAAEMGIHGLVGKSWGLFNAYYQNPRTSSVAQALFTSDFNQIYGALLENTRGKEPYAEWSRAGSNLSSVRAFRNMADGRPVKGILGSSAFSQANVQALVGMRDMSDMILIDYLMSQSDRLSGGNIADYNFVYVIDGNHVKEAREPKNPPVGAAASPNQVVVKKLTLVDNDAGLLNENTFEKKGYLNQISHMHPETYNRLIAFAQKWKEDPSVKEFFHKECTLSTSQVARLEKDLMTAAGTLQSRHAAGKLLLDLDLDDYFFGKTPQPPPAANIEVLGRVALR
jgi:hypothetical protein